MNKLDNLSYKSYWKNITWERTEDQSPWYSGAKFVLDDTEKGVFIIIINKIVTDYHYDIAAFELSSEGNGIFPIIVCSCGMIGCSGAYVEVSHKDDLIVWEHFWHGQCCGKPEPDDEIEFLRIFGNLYAKAPLKFEKDHYKTVVKSIIDELKEHGDSFSYWEYQTYLKQYKSGNVDRV